jgi:hypothetical protein
VAILREADGDGLADLAQRKATSEETIYTRKKCFEGLQVSGGEAAGEQSAVAAIKVMKEIAARHR